MTFTSANPIVPRGCTDEGDHSHPEPVRSNPFFDLPHIEDDDDEPRPADTGSNIAPLYATFDSVAPDPPPPTSSASPALIAHELRQRQILGEYRFSNAEVIQECNKIGVEPMAILLRLDAYARGGDAYSVDDIPCFVNKAAFEQLRLEGKTACCPVPRWVLGATSGNERYSQKPCVSWFCMEHGSDKAEKRMEQAKYRFLRLSEVWFTEMDDDPKSLGRLSKRRSRRGGGTFLVRRDDHRVRCFANMELTGRDGPNHWQKLCPEEALERLALALALPGVVRARWSDNGWIPIPSGDPEPSLVNGENWITLPGVGRERHDNIRQRATELARERWSLTPSKHGFPTDLVDPKEWAKLIKLADAEIKARGG